jgi:hypothetical protein
MSVVREQEVSMHARSARWLVVFAAVGLTVGFIGASGATGASARSARRRRVTTAAAATFVSGEMQAQVVGQNGCGTNVAGEPAIHVSRADGLFAGSEDGVGSGSELWRQLGTAGGAAASACALEYRGQPNAVASGVGASGGDIDLAIASAKNSAGNYNVYVASLNLASISVATSADNGTTFTQTPVQAGVPVDDREWIAAYGARTSLVSYHDIATSEIDVVRSDNSGGQYHQISQAIDPTSPAATSNELGNLVIDHTNTLGTTINALDTSGVGGFYAYQSYVAPKTSADSTLDEMFVAVSNDGGYTWADRPIPCSYAPGKNLAHNFPNVSVAPNGTLWASWSDDTSVYTANSTDHGKTWTCSGAISTGLSRSIFPWLAATANGVDLVYYGTTDPTGPNMTWSVYFQQNPTSAPNQWAAPQMLVTVHKGDVCEGGVSCTGGRQLLDDFGIDTDSAGYAHIVYSHDAPSLGGSSTYTGYAVQTGGQTVGAPNN